MARLRVDHGELFFECSGKGHPVVLLHGFGLDSRMWEPQWETFSSAFRVIRYDLRGFGRSSPVPAERYSHEDDLKALLLSVDAPIAHVVGLSMGGRMALRFAAAYPAMVRSLVLADSALDGYAWSDDWQRRWKEMCECAKEGRIAEAKRKWFEHPLFASARSTSSLASHLSEMIGDYSGWHWRNSDTAPAPSPPLAERLGEIRTPTLAITGSRDLPDFLAIAEKLTAEMPMARRKIIPGAGHMVNLEAPQLFHEVMQEFWAGLG